MKKTVKYIVLVLGSIGILLFSLVFFSFLSDYLNANYDVSLILPLLSVAFLIATIIGLIVFSFKLSNDKNLKTTIIVTAILFLLSATFLILGRAIYPYVNYESNTATTVTKKYADIDKDVFISSFLSATETIDADLKYTLDGDANDSYKFLVYDMLDTDTLAYAVLYVMYDSETNNLKSVAFTSTPKDASLVSKSLDLIAEMLKDNTPSITEKCGISPYVHIESHTETEYMTIIKTLEGDTFTLNALLH